MKWRTTLWMVGIAAALFLFIWFTERHTLSTDQRQSSLPLLEGFRPREVESIIVQRTNSFILQVQRTNNTWEYVAPFSYPAREPAIQSLLDFTKDLKRDFLVSEGSSPSTGTVSNRFGLENPEGVLTLLQGNNRTEIRLGARALSGDKVYAQLVGAPGVYALPSKLIEMLPTAPHDWRETALMHWEGLRFDRLTVSNSARGFSIGFDRTNNVFVLRKPFQARADNEKVGQLLLQLNNARVTQFVTDNPRSDLEPYGLQPPVLQLSFGIDTNDAYVVQFGISPTNDLGSVYARLLPRNNVVLVSRTILDQLRLSYVDMRDAHLFSFNPDAVDTLEVRGSETFNARRQNADAWIVQPGGIPADATLIRELLSSLQKLTVVEFSKDFVTDFAPYGLAPPIYSWTLRGSTTNASGTLTNTLFAQLELGGMLDEKVFVRRHDESSVYAIKLGDAQKLPEAAWKLRERKLWSFTTNEVSLITIEQQGLRMQLRRNPEGGWSVAPGSTGIIKNQFSLEETVHRLGQLRASVWTARGETNRSALGFTDQGHKLTIEVKKNGKSETYKVEFGGRAPSRYTYAATQIDGESWFFEFPFDTYFFVIRDLSIVRPTDL